MCMVPERKFCFLHTLCCATCEAAAGSPSLLTALLHSACSVNGCCHGARVHAARKFESMLLCCMVMHPAEAEVSSSMDVSHVDGLGRRLQCPQEKELSQLRQGPFMLIIIIKVIIIMPHAPPRRLGSSC